MSSIRRWGISAIIPLARKHKPPLNDPEQSKIFIETAREAKADGAKEEFDHAFKKID